LEQTRLDAEIEDVISRVKITLHVNTETVGKRVIVDEAINESISNGSGCYLTVFNLT
jgi:hypothetical protein